MRSIKQINLENRPHYFYNDITNIKNFNSNLLNIHKILFKSTATIICNIKFMIIKSLNQANVDNKNPIYFIFNNLDRYIKESNEDKYLAFASTDKNKEALEKCAKLWDETKNQIETINSSEPIEYKKDFIKTRFESDENLLLGKILSIPGMIIKVIRSVLLERNKYYPQVYLHVYVYDFANKL